jgi:hypothetical protein
MLLLFLFKYYTFIDYVARLKKEMNLESDDNDESIIIEDQNDSEEEV